MDGILGIIRVITILQLVSWLELHLVINFLDPVSSLKYNSNISET